jgi:hypothetical protein
MEATRLTGLWKKIGFGGSHHEQIPPGCKGKVISEKSSHRKRIDFGIEPADMAC